MIYLQNPSQGVCAQVRVQIMQKVTLTRTGFDARLELTNGESDRLTAIKVVLSITDTNGKDAHSLFAIGECE
jgi:hypothetical protein